LLKRINILIIFSFLLVSACGLFDLRESENPVDPRSNFIPPTSPEIVLVNIITAVAEKNLNNYMSCFVDTAYSSRTFVYTADISSQSQYPVFAFWNTNYEKNYFNNLLLLTNSSSTSNLFLSNELYSITPDTVILDADYLMRFDHQKPSVSKTVKGKLRFVLSSDTRNLWSINSWTDYKVNNTDTTWSVLKANFLY
jgi:hypothetical protein